MTSQELTEWKKKVVSLNYIEYKLEKYYEQGNITKKERKKLKKSISKMWIDIWKFHPDNDPLLKQAFELNFV